MIFPEGLMKGIIVDLPNRSLGVEGASVHAGIQPSEAQPDVPSADKPPPTGADLRGSGTAAAHDLLSPLCTIDWISNWIAEEYGDRLGADGREWLSLLQKSVDRMRAVIENVPAFQPLEAVGDPSTKQPTTPRLTE